MMELVLSLRGHAAGLLSEGTARVIRSSARGLRCAGGVDRTQCMSQFIFGAFALGCVVLVL